MLPLLIPAIAVLGGYAWWQTRPRGMTPERKMIYETALVTLKEPDKLRTLADAFENEGFKDEATMLRKRALLREMPLDVKTKRQQAFGAAMKSTDPAKVEAVAMAFQNEGATGAAANLRKYAEGLRKAAA
jgi:hypothetical protein